MTRIAGLRVLGLLAVLALLLAACGETETTTDGETAAETTAPAETEEETEAAEPASGEPIVVGYINQENSPAGSFPEQREAAEAAVQHINEELGGVDGRPIELAVEITDGSPESSANAAQSILEQDSVVVSAGTDFGTAASIPVLEDANMPYSGGVPLLPPELTSEISFQFFGGNVAAFPTQSAYIAEELGADTVNIIYTDVPAGLEAAQTFSQAVLESLGVQEVNLIPEAANATDFTPAVSSANEGDPDAIMVLFAAQGCSRIMQAVESLGVETPMFYPGSCLDIDVIEAGGGGADGAYFNSELILYNDESDEEVATYRDAMETYAPDAKISMYSQAAFASTMNLYDIMTEIGADNVSSETMMQALSETSEQPNFMGNPYSCASPPVPSLPAVCSATARIVQYQDGEFTDLYGDWIDGGDYLGGGGEEPTEGSS